MKRRIIILSTFAAFFIFSSTSCEKPEPFTTFKVIETQVYNEIKAHRENNGISGPFVHQFIMGIEAQLFSAKMAFNSKAVDTTGVSIHWDIIHDKIAYGINDITLVQSALNPSAADIVNYWTSDSTSNALLLSNLSQCAVGVEYGSNSVAYITLMMMLVE